MISDLHQVKSQLFISWRAWGAPGYSCVFRLCDSSHYDSMIAKLITTAQTRQEAINKMKRALDEFYIEGIKATIPFHRKLMDRPDYVAETIPQNSWKILI